MNKYFSFGGIFMTLGVLIQVAVYVITNNTLLSLISGMCGVISVVLCSQRKIHFYTFGFIQLFTYIYLCWEQKLYAEIVENVFYFVTMLYGIYEWNNHLSCDRIETKSLGNNWYIVLGVTICACGGLWSILLNTDDSQPFMDSITTVPAFVAQILMILRYKESWYYWLTIDLGSIIMWSVAGDWCMVAQFVFWSVNCIYGLRKW
jgi:nicotinamide mononucleotide transporter